MGQRARFRNSERVKGRRRSPRCPASVLACLFHVALIAPWVSTTAFKRGPETRTHLSHGNLAGHEGEHFLPPAGPREACSARRSFPKLGASDYVSSSAAK